MREEITVNYFVSFATYKKYKKIHYVKVKFILKKPHQNSFSKVVLFYLFVLPPARLSLYTGPETTVTIEEGFIQLRRQWSSLLFGGQNFLEFLVALM